MVLVPRGLAEATLLREGAAGRAWLDDLPSIVDASCRRWRCVPEGPAWHGQVALVVPVQHASGPAVLKVSFPHEGNRGEAEALRCFDGQGAVRLVRVDHTGLVLLLERAEPSTLAERVGTPGGPSVEEALEIAGDLAQQLRVAGPPTATALAATMNAWEEQFDRQTTEAPGRLSAGAVARARRTMRQLADDTTSTMLHGDLHFANIVRSWRQSWVTIDPKGLSGLPEWDAFTVVAGRHELLQGETDLGHAVSRRIERFSAAAGLDLDLAEACCQARAASSYLYQQIVAGSWFDLAFLRVLAESGQGDRGARPGC